MARAPPGEGEHSPARHLGGEMWRFFVLSMFRLWRALQRPRKAARTADARRPVSRVLSLRTQGMAIRLGRPSPDASRDQPGRPARKPACRRRKPTARRPYSVLLPVGFTVPATLPPPRCALTAPFHPCPPAPANQRPGGRSALCGTFPGVAPAGRYPAPCFRGARTFLPPAQAGRRPSDRLAPLDT